MFTLRTTQHSEAISLRQLPTLRQAFVVAALLILLAVLLAKLVHPDWMYLALLPGVGLLISGLSGICPLVYFLQLIPGNRPDNPSQ